MIPLDTWGTYALVDAPRAGVITYEVINLPATIATLATVAIMATSAALGSLGGQIGVGIQVAAFGGF